MRKWAWKEWIVSYPSLIMAVAFLPLIAATLYLVIQEIRLAEVKERIERFYLETRLTLDKRVKREEFLTRYEKKRAQTAIKQLEGLRFLEDEETLLTKLCSEPAFSTRADLNKRLVFLNSKNHLAFQEKESAQNSKIKETRYSQEDEVEMGPGDLSLLLALTDQGFNDPLNQAKDLPQILVTGLSLRRASSPFSQKETLYKVKLDLLIREYLQR